MRFLLTGATGFIGSHMAELLLSRGWEVVCPARNTSRLRNLAGIAVRVIPLEDLQAEVASNPNFDYVIHLGGATRAGDYNGYRESNVEFTRELLQTFSQPSVCKTLRRFVLVSSQAASGPCPDDGTHVTETDARRPVSLYGRSKAEAEQVAERFQETLPITVVRPPTVFGPRDKDVLGVFKSARFRLAPYIAGPDRLVSIIYVQDLVEGILAAAISPQAVGQTYFLANPKPVIWRQFALDVARLMGYRAFPLPVPAFAMKLVARGGDVIGRLRGAMPLFRSEKFEEMKQLAWVCSPEKAYRELQWRPRFSLDEAIRLTARWYGQHGWL
jgi:nucleoside-diphosphate-sugar epimerase